MDVMFQRVAGLDIARDSVSVCVRTPGRGQTRVEELAEFSTMPAQLARLGGWLADRDVEVTVRLTGHLDAIDGRYHWRGMLTGDLPPDILTRHRDAPLTVDGQSVDARVVERTPWGSYTVAGVGVPPFAPV